MRLGVIFALSTALTAAIAAPAAAGVGQCLWEHLPQEERDKAIAPVAIPADSTEFADTLAAAITEPSVNAAMAACGLGPEQQDAAIRAVDTYGYRRWAEHHLFLYDAHIPPRQLDDAWNALHADLKQRLVREGATDEPSPELTADLSEAEAKVQAFLKLGTIATNEQEAALRIYVLARAQGE